MSALQHGLLLFAHGARDAAWAQPFEAVAQRCAARAPGSAVSLAFLEFMQPDLLTAAAGLVERGCVHIDVVPLFLGTGGHVRKDLPRLLEQLAQQHPGVQWRLRPAIGESSTVIEAMAEVALANTDSP